MHPTLSKWLSTLELYTKENAIPLKISKLLHAQTLFNRREVLQFKSAAEDPRVIDEYQRFDIQRAKDGIFNYLGRK